jgi:hypothetical protein
MVGVSAAPQIRIPKKFQKDPETRKFFEHQQFWLFLLWKRTGGGTDTILDSESGSGFEMPDKVIQEWNAVTKTSDYTAVSFDFINAKQRATIKFPEFPDENDVIIIRNGDGSVISLDGNGKDINGSSTGKLFRKGTSIEFHYFIDSDEWFAR